MKTVIFYSSTYNGNTLKIAESIAATLSADLIAIETKISDFDLSQYDLIGIGSAIHFGQHAIRLQRFVSALPLQGKNRHKAQRKAKFYINKCRSASCMQSGWKRTPA